MNEIVFTQEYLQELRKISESIERLSIRLERHINRVLSGKEEDTVLVTRSEAAEFLGITPRQFDRRAKERHFWRYTNSDGTGLKYNMADLSLSKDEGKEKWVKGILAKQVDTNCNVIRKPSGLMNSREARLLQEALNDLEQ